MAQSYAQGTDVAQTMIPGASHTVYEEIQQGITERYAGHSDTPLLKIGGTR